MFKHILVFFVLLPLVLSGQEKSSGKVEPKFELKELSDCQGNAVVQKYARLLDVNDSVIFNPQLYMIIDEWIGTPYKSGGNTKKGTDCSGFVGQVMKSFTTTYLPRSASDMSKIVKLKDMSELQEGDLVFFNLRNIPNKHVGIYLHNGWFVHSSSYKGIGVTLSNLNAPNYKRRFSKCGSIE